MNIDYRKHWDNVYSRNKVERSGWYEETPKPSLDLISKCKLSKDSVILDVGSGATTLIKHLINQGYKNIIATDISSAALNLASERLNDEESSLINWIADDITRPSELLKFKSVDLWHDRTVLHFLTEEQQRKGYLSTLRKLVNPDGYVIIAVFSLEGAKKCSGLDVVNYSHTMISEFLGDEFKLLEHFSYLYIQPSGGERPYVYTLFKRKLH